MCIGAAANSIEQAASDVVEDTNFCWALRQRYAIELTSFLWHVPADTTETVTEHSARLQPSINLHDPVTALMLSCSGTDVLPQTSPLLKYFRFHFYQWLHWYSSLPKTYAFKHIIEFANVCLFEDDSNQKYILRGNYFYHTICVSMKSINALDGMLSFWNRKKLSRKL